MKTFVGGQIREEYRQPESSLAIIINHKKDKPRDYGVLLYEVGSQEFNQLTGAMNIGKCPVDRVYIGVSNKIGDEIAQESDRLRSGQLTLESIDGKLVYPVFLMPEVQSKPRRMWLELDEKDGRYDLKLD